MEELRGLPGRGNACAGGRIGAMSRRSRSRSLQLDNPPGLREGRLAQCPAGPHCVSSLEERPARRVAPIGYAIARAEVSALLLELIGSWPRMQIVTAGTDYIHAVQRSRVFRFPDDLECHLPADERLVYLRSCARFGWYDFGVNRARVERLRQAVNRRLAQRR